MSNKKIGYEINIPEDSKLVSIPMSKELNEYFKKENKKNYIYYLKKFIGGDKNYEIAFDTVKDCMKKALPKDRKESCKYCLGLSDDKGDKLCERYNSQMMFTYFVAGNEFLRIVFKNKFLQTDKVILQKLTINFFDCLHFIENQGKMYFDLDKMCRYCLHAGFLSLSKMFSSSSSLNNIKVINESLNSLHDEELENRIHNKEDGNYIDIQKNFFENKRRYYKDNIYIENERKKIEPVKKIVNDKRPNRTDIAYYCYYTSQTKTLEINSVFPSDKAWIEIGERFNKNHKNIQKTYNLISHNKTERLKSTKANNIKYVINNILNENKEALNLAKDELKLVELNS